MIGVDEHDDVVLVERLNVQAFVTIELGMDGNVAALADQRLLDFAGVDDGERDAYPGKSLVELRHQGNQQVGTVRRHAKRAPAQRFAGLEQIRGLLFEGKHPPGNLRQRAAEFVGFDTATAASE